MENNLTINEKNALETFEGVIQREMGSFIAVGKALLTIRDHKLYREEFRNFKAYCAERWGMGREYAHRLISGSQVAANLLPIGNNFSTLVKIQPTSEYQIRPLAILEPAQQREIWEEAVKTAPAGKVTSKHVKALVDELVGPAPPPPPKKKDPHPESDAHAFVSMAMINLEMIRDDDPRREEALNKLLNWINEKLKEKPTKKSS